MLTYTRLIHVHTSARVAPDSVAATYKDINWRLCTHNLLELQAEIVLAYRNKKYNLMYQKQKELIRSFSARALSVKKISSYTGNEIPGIDGEIWDTDEKKFSAINKLKNLSKYSAKPVRRIYIDKSDGTKRLLCIPTLYDRSVQVLWNFALTPIAEERADSRSYGFRPYRSVHDCITYIKLVASSVTATRRFVLDVDIKKLFDSVSHDWLLENIPMDKLILKEFLTAGFMQDYEIHPSTEGFPKGSVISPTIANMTLDGLEKVLGKEFLMTRYAGDFIVLGKSKSDLLDKALPAISTFLSERSLSLNLNKIKLTELSEGFEFLGFQFKEFPDLNRAKGAKRGIFLVQPSPDNVKNFIRKLSRIVKAHRHSPTTVLITKLNSILIGWSERYRHVSSKKVFNKVNVHLFRILWKRLKKKYPRAPKRDLFRDNFTKIGNNKWIFSAARFNSENPDSEKITLFQIAYVNLKKHTICKPLNSYDPNNYEYFAKKQSKITLFGRKPGAIQNKLLKNQKGLCPVCNDCITSSCETEVHNIILRKEGSSNNLSNLKLLHKSCHHQVTQTKNGNLLALFKELGIIT